MKINTKRISRLSILLPFTVLVLIAACAKKDNGGGGTNTPALDAEVSILTTQTHQVIQGFGGATVFRPTVALTTEELDRLFGKANAQVGLNILRIRVTDDPSWRAIELANAKGAIQRGAKVIGTPWSPPAKFKTNNNIIGGALIADSGAGYAKYLNDFANYMASNGAPLYAISVQNEPDVKVTYESCDWTANEMMNFLKNHGHLITATKVIATESFNNNQIFTNAVLADPTAAANVDIVGGHIYGGGVVENTLAKTQGKEVWMTEHLDTLTTYTANLATATEIHQCLTTANFNAYIWWYAKRFYGPIGEDGLITKRGYIMSQFAKFVTPGSIRLGTSANTKADALVSAYKTTSGKKIIVVVNNYSSPVKQTFNIKDATVTEVMPYTTASNTDLAAGTKLTVSNNSFTYTLPALSITTFVEQ
jgi:glucuronoarabinoxylan endo-1,4-beta-xylanase